MTPLFACFPVCLTFVAIGIVGLIVVAMGMYNRTPLDDKPEPATGPSPYGVTGPPRGGSPADDAGGGPGDARAGVVLAGVTGTKSEVFEWLGRDLNPHALSSTGF